MVPAMRAATQCYYINHNNKRAKRRFNIYFQFLFPQIHFSTFWRVTKYWLINSFPLLLFQKGDQFVSCLDPRSTRICSLPLLLPYHTPLSWVLPSGKRIDTNKLTSFSLGFLQLGGIQDRKISLGNRGTYEREWVFSDWKQIMLERYDSPEDRAGGNWNWHFCVRHRITAKGSSTTFLTALRMENSFVFKSRPLIHWRKIWTETTYLMLEHEEMVHKRIKKLFTFIDVHGSPLKGWRQLLCFFLSPYVRWTRSSF